MMYTMQQRDSVLVSAPSSVQQNAETPADARSIISNSMSPFCPGLTLQACPSPSADSLRHVIIARVRRGDSREQIMQDLYTDFGEAIRAAPPAAGFGLIAWMLPGVVIALAAFFLTYWLRARARSRAGASDARRVRAGGDGESPVSRGPTRAEVERLETLLKRDT